MLLNAAKSISVLIFLVWFGPNEKRNSKINFTLVLIYCVMCCEYVENELQNSELLYLFLFCLVKFS